MCLSISKALILMQTTPQIWKLCTVRTVKLKEKSFASFSQDANDL